MCSVSASNWKQKLWNAFSVLSSFVVSPVRRDIVLNSVYVSQNSERTAAMAGGDLRVDGDFRGGGGDFSRGCGDVRGGSE